MNRRHFRLCAVAVAFAPLYASAAGLGEIVIQSRVGESLRAEIPVTSAVGEAIDTACFSLAPSQNADMPVVTNAKIKLVRDGRGLRLVITGSKAIAEPLFLLSVRANCGIDLQRDYMVMPPPPFVTAEAEATPSLQPPTHRATPTNPTKSYREWRAREGDTLVGIAEAMAPGDPIAQERLLSRMQSLNPEMDPEQGLADGTSVLLPKPRQATSKPKPSASEVPKKRTTRQSELPQPPRPEKPAVAPQVNTQDRLIVGEAPAELRSGELATPLRTEMNDTEARILKMEQTLSSLRQELEKIDAALAITAEIVVTQEKLKLAKSLQSTANGAIESAAVAPPTTQSSNSTYRSWLELLLSALLGGAAAAGIAQWLGRKKQKQAPEIKKTAAPAQRSQVFATAPATPGSTTSMPLKVEEPPQEETRLAYLPVKDVDFLLDSETTKQPVAPPADIHLNESASLVELAEIMLSFGRVQGAAETLAIHITENSPDNIKHWITLLDLYRRGNMRDDFEAFAPKVRARFNLEIPSWDASTTAISGLKSIDDYTHVASNITRLWGTPECLKYLDSLVRNVRDKERSGFPLEVVEEIILLTHILEDAYGLKHPA